mgnify:CR=1 FL=1|jgi:hypothetical protein
MEDRLNQINQQINQHYEQIRILKKEKNKIYSSKYYKLNKLQIIEKVKIRKYNKSKLPLTFKKKYGKVELTF